jgi:hypothetical protein
MQRFSKGLKIAGVISVLGIPRESMYSENRNREGSCGRGIVGYLARRLARYSLKLVAGHFRRDPVAISQGVGKLEWRLREDENLRNRPQSAVKKEETSLVLINRDDRMSWEKQSITNEVKVLWHKGFCPTSTKKRELKGE